MQSTKLMGIHYALGNESNRKIIGEAFLQFLEYIHPPSAPAKAVWYSTMTALADLAFHQNIRIAFSCNSLLQNGQTGEIYIWTLPSGFALAYP